MLVAVFVNWSSLAAIALTDSLHATRGPVWQGERKDWGVQGGVFDSLRWKLPPQLEALANNLW